MMTNRWDATTEAHLDKWLAKRVWASDEQRAEVRRRMIRIASSDPHYWLNKSWWDTWRAAKCDDVDAEGRS